MSLMMLVTLAAILTVPTAAAALQCDATGCRVGIGQLLLAVEACDIVRCGPAALADAVILHAEACAPTPDIMEVQWVRSEGASVGRSVALIPTDEVTCLYRGRSIEVSSLSLGLGLPEECILGLGALHASPISAVAVRCD